MSKALRNDGGLACGASTFVLVERLNADRIFEWQAQARCLSCGNAFMLKRGDAAAVLKVGNEIVGAVCPQCLSEETREQLAALRSEVAR